MKILITGASGFIGAHLSKYALDNNNIVHMCDNNMRGIKDTFIDDLNVKPDMTAHRMAQNFMKKNNSFKTNRIILSRFIDLITENTTV